MRPWSVPLSMTARLAVIESIEQGLELVGKGLLGVGAIEIAELVPQPILAGRRSEEHTSELQSLMRISYAVFCLKKKTYNTQITKTKHDRTTTQNTHTR